MMQIQALIKMKKNDPYIPMTARASTGYPMWYAAPGRAIPVTTTAAMAYPITQEANAVFHVRPTAIRDEAIFHCVVPNAPENHCKIIESVYLFRVFLRVNDIRQRLLKGRNYF